MKLTFVESRIFTRALPEYLSDDEYGALQRFLGEHPTVGDVIPGSGGVRKLRWAAGGRDTRGGVRVIYFLRTAAGEIWLLTICGKSAQANIPAHVLRAMKEAIDHAQDDGRRARGLGEDP